MPVNSTMKHYFLFLVFGSLSLGVNAQQVDDETLLNNLKAHVKFLADDKLEGRRTGTKGEKTAADYIKKNFKKAGLASLGDGFIQEFDVNEGKVVGSKTSLTVNDKTVPADAYFPMAWSPSGKFNVPASAMKLIDVSKLVSDNAHNPHFDLENAIRENTGTGTSLIVLYNSSNTADNLKFNRNDKNATASIPVIYLKDRSLLPDFRETKKVKLRVDISNSSRKGRNVIGFINNNAAHTIVLGAHFDHLGYGEDRNSLYAGSDRQIHNGADDNASGTAALIELGSMLKKYGPKQNNYILVAFSGEELGLYGSKYFTEHSPVPLTGINYMINMDMVGRLDSTKGLTVGGYGTSPAWSSAVTSEKIRISFDSSGSGPSDHTSFYRKDIPVLFFFTGSHQDYHKPSDDAHLVNYEGQKEIVKLIYSVIEKTSGAGRLSFLKTREPVMARTSFKVSLGIMPDYTFSGTGVKVDGVSDGRPAQKAGIKTGDVVTKLGNHVITDVQTYMEALSKFNKGETVTVEVDRAGSKLSMPLTF